MTSARRKAADQLQQPGTRQPDRRLVADPVAERHAAIPGLQASADDRPVDRALPAGDVHPLEGRAGRGGADQDAPAIGHHHLAVGAEVDGRHRAGRTVEAVVDQACQRIGP